MARVTFSGRAPALGVAGGPWPDEPRTLALPAEFANTVPSTRAGFVAMGNVSYVTGTTLTFVTFPGHSTYWMVTGETA